MTNNNRIIEPPRVRMIRAVLESAQDVGEEEIVAACRRLLEANRKGWAGHYNRMDLAIVRAVYEDLRGESA